MKKKKVVIFGSGNHAKVIFSEILKDKSLDFLGFVDDKKIKKQTILEHNKKKFYNLGSIREMAPKKNKIYGIIGIGHNFEREKVFNLILKYNSKFKFLKIISKDAIINTKRIMIGNGTVVMSGAIINFGTKVGKNCIINTSSSIDHDNFLDDFSSIGPGAITSGNVVIGKNTHIGLGAKIMQKVIIGKNTVIGACSFINKKCKPYSIYYGIPGKLSKSRKYNDKYL